MGTKAILLAVRDQLEDAIAQAQQATPAHKVYAAQYETAEEFWRDVGEQSRGWDVSYKMKGDLDWRRLSWDRPPFENIDHAYFWPSIRPLRVLLRRVEEYADKSPV